MISKKYIRYEIENRIFSSNVIAGIYLNEKKEEKKELVLAPLLRKDEGDKYAEFVCKSLNDEKKFMSNVHIAVLSAIDVICEINYNDIKMDDEMSDLIPDDLSIVEIMMEAEKKIDRGIGKVSDIDAIEKIESMKVGEFIEWVEENLVY